MGKGLHVIVAGIVAVVAWAALALQLGLDISHMGARGEPLAVTIWRFFGFFTILANLAVAIVASAMVIRPDGPLAGPRVRLATATAIALVGIVYSLLLRRYWQPTGWYAFADHALHDVVPPSFLLAWLLWEHGSLRWRDVVWAAVPPAVYFIYALARGAFDSWYPYWFLDPNALSPMQMSMNAVLLLAGFLAVALVFVAADRWLSRDRAP